jgi:hypothetical protein
VDGMTRYALLRTKDNVSVVRHYLPSNYTAEFDPMLDAIVISGFDVAGWTLDGYVIPRLNSGNYYPKEI